MDTKGGDDHFPPGRADEEVKDDEGQRDEQAPIGQPLYCLKDPLKVQIPQDVHKEDNPEGFQGVAGPSPLQISLGYFQGGSVKLPGVVIFG